MLPPPAFDVPLFANLGFWGYWIHLPVLVLAISLVYGATRYDQWPHTFREARRWVVRLIGFLAIVIVVLWMLAVVI
jgi:hypothetical protein